MATVNEKLFLLTNSVFFQARIFLFFPVRGVADQGRHVVANFTLMFSQVS
jgi:hypothetical protein